MHRKALLNKTFSGLRAVCAAALAILIAGSPVQARGSYVRSSGTSLTLAGAKFTPRGVNLGNWFVLEAYMIGGGSSNEQVRTAFLTLAGSEAGYQKWRAAYLANYTTVQDIRRLKALGFNTVRVPLDWRDFVDGKGDAVDTGLYGTALPTNAPLGLAYLDHLLNWCNAAGVYVLPEMHVTPGTAAGNSSEIYVNSATDVNPNLDQVKASWATIARRYRNANNILGYDLLNEPPGSLNSQYRPTYQQIQSSIRRYDTNHLLVLESNVYADLGDTIDGDGFLGKPIDANMVVSIHSYGGDMLPPASIDADYPTQANNHNGRAYYAYAYADKENVPVLIGETGENDNNWVNAIVHLWAVGKKGSGGPPITAGVLYWDYKKPGNSVRSVVSVPFVPGWSAIENYLNKGGSAPPDSSSLLMRQAAVSGYGSETLHPDVVDALLRDYHASGRRPFPQIVPVIPGVVKAAGFDMGLVSPVATPGDYNPFSYYSANAHTQTYQVRDDRVGTYLSNGVGVVGCNNSGDWQNYRVRTVPGTCQVFLDYGAPSSGPQISLSLNGVSLLTTAPLPATGGYQSYQETPVGTVRITANGPATLRVTTVQAGLDYVRLRFVKAAASGSTVLRAASFKASPAPTGISILNPRK